MNYVNISSHSLRNYSIGSKYRFLNINNACADYFLVFFTSKMVFEKVGFFSDSSHRVSLFQNGWVTH